MPDTSMRTIRVALLLAGLVTLTAACSSSSGGDGDSDSSPGTVTTPANGSTAQRALPPIAAQLDYQLSGAYPPAASVRIVSRDSTAAPAPGIYNICYINAFQAQPDAVSWWQTNHPDLLLRGPDGAMVIDHNWNEPLLDVSTNAKRTQVAQIEYGWIDACAKKGFQAVEPDNLDSYSRSDGVLTMDENAAFATLLAAHAHGDALAIAQKNTTDLLSRHQQIGFDFAVAEQCGANDECDQYASDYSNRVIDIENDGDGMAAACTSWAGRLSIVQRDLDLTAQGSTGYVYRTC